MTRYLILMVTLLQFSCAPSKKDIILQDNNKARKEYLKNLEGVEEFFQNNYVGTIPSDEIEFLERITGIKSYLVKSFEELYRPSKENITNWKEWYDNNQNLLYWDKKTKNVRVKSK